MLPKSNYIPSVHGGNRLVQEKLAYVNLWLTFIDHKCRQCRR
jgi:hypothetical protein